MLFTSFTNQPKTIRTAIVLNVIHLNKTESWGILSLEIKKKCCILWKNIHFTFCY